MEAAPCTACGNAIRPTEKRWVNRDTLDVVHERSCRQVLSLAQRDDDAAWVLVDASGEARLRATTSANHRAADAAARERRRARWREQLRRAS